MNFDTLDYFSILAREHSFTRAAEELHITQQSLSSHIAALEKELGCPLVVRRIPLELTYAGQTFLRYCEQIRGIRRTMQQEFCDIAQNQKGELRLGVSYTRGRSLLSRVIPAFLQQYPQVRISVTETRNEGLHRLLLDGSIDLAIADFPKALPEVELQPFYDEALMLCVSDALLPFCGDDFLQSSAPLSPADLRKLQNCPFVLGCAEDIGGRLSRELLHRAGFQPIVRASSENIETLLELCEAGVGACFSPGNLLSTALGPERASRLYCRALEGASYPIRFGHLKRAYQWSMIDAFLRIARETVLGSAQNG